MPSANGNRFLTQLTFPPYKAAEPVPHLEGEGGQITPLLKFIYRKGAFLYDFNLRPPILAEQPAAGIGNQDGTSKAYTHFAVRCVNRWLKFKDHTRFYYPGSLRLVIG